MIFGAHNFAQLKGEGNETMEAFKHASVLLYAVPESHGWKVEKDAPYIRIDGDDEGNLLYRCLLCKRESDTSKGLQFHCNDPSHIAKVKELRNERVNLLHLMDKWSKVQRSLFNANDDFSNLKEVRSKEGKNAIEASLYRFLTVPSGRYYSDYSHLSKACEDMEKYELQEQLTLLHLAVDKAECLKSMPLGLDFFAARQYMTQGWKEKKADLVDSKSASIVVSAVRQFLDPQPALGGTTKSASHWNDMDTFPHSNLLLATVPVSQGWEYEEGANYIVKKGTRCCQLCLRSTKSMEGLIEHCEEPTHIKRVKALRQDQENLRSLMRRWSELQKPIAKSTASRFYKLYEFGNRAGRDAVTASLFRYLTTPPYHVFLHTASEDMEKYEYLEQLSLVSLAVWKAECLWQMPLGLNYYDAQRYIKVDWKNKKVDLQESNARSVGTIAQHIKVLPNTLSSQGPIGMRNDQLKICYGYSFVCIHSNGYGWQAQLSTQDKMSRLRSSTVYISCFVQLDDDE
jgi:hypothetical protein